LQKFSRELQWTESQVVVEAIQAFCELHGADKMVFSVPSIILLYRGLRSLFEEKQTSRLEILGELNLLLKFFVPPDFSLPTITEGMITDIDLA